MTLKFYVYYILFVKFNDSITVLQIICLLFLVYNNLNQLIINTITWLRAFMWCESRLTHRNATHIKEHIV